MLRTDKYNYLKQIFEQLFENFLKIEAVTKIVCSYLIIYVTLPLLAVQLYTGIATIFHIPRVRNCHYLPQTPVLTLLLFAEYPDTDIATIYHIFVAWHGHLLDRA